MKLHKHLVNSIAIVLKEIFKEGRYADKAIERLFKSNPKWGSRDRRFVAEAVYDITRYYRLYSELAGSADNFWFMVAIWLSLKEPELPDWQEFRDIDLAQIRRHLERLRQRPEIMESYPDWLWNEGIKELGNEVWVREAAAMNIQADVFLRVNVLKKDVATVQARLADEKIVSHRVDGLPHALKLEKRANVFQTKAFKEGWIEVQDGGSQMIGLFTGAGPGETVVDACAGAGGKSLQIAAQMNNKGRIISMDVEQWKLDELRRRASRGGADNIETRLISGPEVIKSLAGKADKVLLDVPCSGTGVLRRNPDAKWKLSAASLEKTRSLQQQIISEYSQMVRPGGTLIYSTCSILPEENQKQVADFLEGNKEFQLAEERTILPSSGFDGFYMARLTRKK